LGIVGITQLNHPLWLVQQLPHLIERSLGKIKQFLPFYGSELVQMWEPVKITRSDLIFLLGILFTIGTFSLDNTGLGFLLVPSYKGTLNIMDKL